MSEENLERVRRIVGALAAGDLQSALKDVRIELRVHRLAPLPDPATYRGPAGMLMAWGEWTAPYEDLEMTLGELVDAGHSVGAEIRQRGRRKDTGAPVEEEFWFVFTFFEGELVQWDMLASRRQALRGLAMVQEGSDR